MFETRSFAPNSAMAMGSDRALSAIDAVSQFMESGTDDLPAFFSGLAATIAELVGARKLGIATLDPGGTTVSQEGACFGFTEEEAQAFQRVPTDQNGRDMFGRIVYADDFFLGEVRDDDPELVPYMRMLQSIGAHSGMVVAWSVGGQHLGLMHAWGSFEGEFSADDIRVLRTAALTAGLVWQHELALRRLQHAQREAEDANTAKSDFLSRISHELRTPLSAVLGYAELLELSWLEDRQREQVAAILHGGNHLLKLITDILDISRIDSGAMHVSLDSVDLGQVVTEAVDLVQPIALNRGIAIQARSHPRLFVNADRQRLKQVLVNLIGNAVKYNRENGKVTVAITKSGDIGARVSVTDTGHGIKAEDLEKLFIPFERLDAERHGIDGTGLGLALSRNLIEAMSGGIGVRSTVGEGSTFWVDLEALPTDIGPRRRNGLQEGLALRELNGTKILYIEDSRANIDLMEEMLSRRPGLTFLSANEGADGIAQAKAVLPNLIFLDVHLPDMLGEDVLRELKANKSTSAIPVIVLSADATPEQQDRLLAAGAKLYLTKPVSVRSLLAELDEIL